MADRRYEGYDTPPRKERQPGRETYRSGQYRSERYADDSLHYPREMIREYAKGTPRPISEQDLDTYEVVDPVEFFGWIDDFHDLLAIGAIEKIERIMDVPHTFEKKFTASKDGINLYFVVEKTTP